MPLLKFVDARKWMSLIPLVALTVAFSSSAFAQSGDVPAVPGVSEPPAVKEAAHAPLEHHDGLMYGAAFGFGSIDLSGTDGNGGPVGLAFAGSVGWFLHRRLAIMYDLTAVLAGNFDPGFGSQSATNMAHVLALQVWPTSSLWVKAGAGYGHILFKTSQNFSSSSTGSYTFALGYDVWHNNENQAVDVQARFVLENYDGNYLVNMLLMVGTSWY